MSLSPFPGMDPYLETPAKWSSIHTRLITALSDQLTAQLGSQYSVDIEQRVYILTPGEARKYIVPDIFGVQLSPSTAPTAVTTVITPPTLVDPVVETEIRERYFEKLDYTQPAPAPRLRPADLVWAKEQVLAWQKLRV